jgi:hypothetical protein
MKIATKSGALLVIFATFSLAGAAELPKVGKFSAHFGWVFKGDVQELGAQRTVFVGMVDGVLFNNAGTGGVMHKARVNCALMNDVSQGRANARGTCEIIDADGDKAFLEWKCAGAMPACPGDQRFVGGTGKYTGISGTSKFQGNFIGNTGAGWSDWSWEYTLP